MSDVFSPKHKNVNNFEQMKAECLFFRGNSSKLMLFNSHRMSKKSVDDDSVILVMFSLMIPSRMLIIRSKSNQVVNLISHYDDCAIVKSKIYHFPLSLGSISVARIVVTREKISTPFLSN